MNNKYFIAVEKNTNTFTLIDTADLETSNHSSIISLQQLDNFTKDYTKDTLAELIIRANIVSEYDIDELSRKLCVVHLDVIKGKNKWRKSELIDNTKYNYIIKITNYLDYALSDKELLNKLYNLLSKYTVKYKKDLKNALYNKNLNGLYNFIKNLEYENQRKVYLYISEMIENDEDFNRINKPARLEKKCA